MSKASSFKAPSNSAMSQEDEWDIQWRCKSGRRADELAADVSDGVPAVN